jgi:hypothetical protein
MSSVNEVASVVKLLTCVGGARFETRPAHRPSSDLSVVLLLHVDSTKYLKLNHTFFIYPFQFIIHCQQTV